MGKLQYKDELFAFLAKYGLIMRDWFPFRLGAFLGASDEPLRFAAGSHLWRWSPRSRPTSTPINLCTRNMF